MSIDIDQTSIILDIYCDCNFTQYRHRDPAHNILFDMRGVMISTFRSKYNVLQGLFTVCHDILLRRGDPSIAEANASKYETRVESIFQLFSGHERCEKDQVLSVGSW